MSSTFGVTPEGYVLKTQAVINSEVKADMLQVVDPVSGESLQLDFNSDNPIAQITLIILEQLADALLDNQNAYDQFDVNKATGSALSSVVLLNGIERSPTPSVVTLFFTDGTALFSFPSGLVVKDPSGSEEWQTSAFTLDGGGENNSVLATCLTAGPVSAEAGSLTEIVGGNANVDAVTNPSPAIVGLTDETDTQLRIRQKNSTEVPAIGLPAGLRAALLDIPEVTFSRVYLNNTDTIDANGIAPKTLACVVVGGDDTEIALTIISRGGIAAYQGDTTVILADKQSIEYPISFYRATEIDILLDISITILQLDVFPQTGLEDIKTAIVEYAQFGADALNITEGFNEVGFNVGDDITQSRLYTPINSVPGHKINSILINAVDADFAIGVNEIGRFLTSSITVIPT